MEFKTDQYTEHMRKKAARERLNKLMEKKVHERLEKMVIEEFNAKQLKYDYYEINIPLGGMRILCDLLSPDDYNVSDNCYRIHFHFKSKELTDQFYRTYVYSDTDLDDKLKEVKEMIELAFTLSDADDNA